METDKMEKLKMDQKMYEQIINKNKGNLLGSLTYETLSPWLIQEDVITAQDDNEIKGQNNSNMRMLSIFLTVLLSKKLETVYHKFKVVLQHCGYELALDYLTKSEKEIKDGKI